MDLVTLMTLKLTAQQVGADRFGNRYYEERRARRGKPPRRYVRYNGMAGCIIPNHHRRQKVAMTSMSGSENICPMSPEQSTPIAPEAIF